MNLVSSSICNQSSDRTGSGSLILGGEGFAMTLSDVFSTLRGVPISLRLVTTGIAYLKRRIAFISANHFVLVVLFFGGAEEKYNEDKVIGGNK